MTYKLGPVRTFGKGVYEVTVDGRGDASGDSSPSMSPLGSVRTHSSSNSTTETMPESAPLPPIVRQHDILNLVLIMGLNILNVCFLAGWSDGSLLKHCSVAYFLADMLFVAGWPQVVKSPGVILGHHTVSLGLIAIPYLYPQPFTMNGLAYCMLVEINTWFLISKRTIPYAKALQEALFYASWVILRLMWYPYLCYSFTQEWLSRWEATGTPWNAILIAPIFQIFLTSLNVQWTLALLLKKKKGPRAKQL